MSPVMLPLGEEMACFMIRQKDLQVMCFPIMFLLSLLRNHIIEEKSFVPCEDLKYGRISFKGFNPEVEVGLQLSSF